MNRRIDQFRPRGTRRASGWRRIRLCACAGLLWRGVGAEAAGATAAGANAAVATAVDATAARAAADGSPGSEACFRAASWPQADALFHRDPRWAGSDCAYSVDLGGGRSLWLFGDTWIDPTARHSRRGARMIRNSIAIQTGDDPSRASITFYWGSDVDGVPTDFFPPTGNQWYWPGHGVRVGGRLLLFLGRVRGSQGGLGFEVGSWNAVMVRNPDAEPPQWEIVPLGTPLNPLGVVVGFAGALLHEEYVYAFGAQEPVKSHPIFVARWPVERVRQSNLRAPQWWAGADMGWVKDGTPVPRWPLFEDGQSELTIHYDEVSRRFLAFQTVGFGAAELAMRSASELAGPWTAPTSVYRPPEADRDNVLIYSAKAHPQLSGADLVLTYATNLLQFEAQVADSLIYYPRFVRLTRCR